MNWTQVEGKWEQLKGDVKTRWGKLTDDDLKVVGGQLDRLVGKIVERYGVKKEQAHQEIEAWVERSRMKIGAVGEADSRPDTTRPKAILLAGNSFVASPLIDGREADARACSQGPSRPRCGIERFRSHQKKQRSPGGLRMR